MLLLRRLAQWKSIGATALLIGALLLSAAQTASANSNQIKDVPNQGKADFFIQISDAHVYQFPEDFFTFSSPAVPWYIPDFAVPWITVSLLKRTYGEDVISKIREELKVAGYEGDVDGASETEIYEIFARERANDQGIFGSLDSRIQAAFKEVAALNPQFVINTGDLVLESNKGTPEAIDRWFKYYLALTADFPMPIYNTIGNNEIAGSENPDFKPDNPKFGEYFFKHYFGDTHYSFDRGDFHFIALDTHSPDPKPDDPNYWDFGKMTPETKAWFEKDLATHQGKPIVVLNHEPFHFDPKWPFKDNGSRAKDEGLFKKYGVDYVLTGHTHYRSEMDIDGIHHLTAGALSGMRWVLPASVHERGYRLFQSQGDELFSLWKQTGKLAIDFSAPQPIDQTKWVIGVVDIDKPFKSVSFSRAGEAVDTVKLGDYFYELTLPQESGKQVDVKVVRANGEVITRQLNFHETMH